MNPLLAVLEPRLRPVATALLCLSLLPTAAADGEAEVPRIGVHAARIPAAELSPLSYTGGFQTKTLLYETLVRRGADGRIVPGLAESWEVSQGGLRWEFVLRRGLRYHDGRAVDAESVAGHFRRWVRLPEHSWIRCNEDIRAVEAVGDAILRIELSRPHALLSDLCAINPCSIRGPGSVDREGVAREPIGTGPFRFVEEREEGRVLRLQAVGERARALDLVRLDKGDDALDALHRGDLDVVADGWFEPVGRERYAQLAASDEFEGQSSEGSSVFSLGFRLVGATARRELRQAVAAAIDREALVTRVEGGHADACDTWAAPCMADWPSARPVPQPARAVDLDSPLRFAAPSDDRARRLTRALIEQLAAAGIPAEVVDSGEGARAAWDLRIERSWGMPYDPDLSFVSRFDPAEGQTAATRVEARIPDGMRRLARELERDPDPARRPELYRRIQEEMDRESWLVPLYVPHRLALRRTGLPALELGPDLYRTALASWISELPSSFSVPRAGARARPADEDEEEEPDPTKREVPLPTASADWNASLVIDNGETGVWTVKPYQLLPQYACPEVIGCDDQGRLLIMVGYSGKWTPNVWIHDGKWLGGLTHGDVDPRIPGPELYTGGQKGNLYMVTGSPQGALEARRLGWLPGREIHTIVVDPFAAARGDSALLVFTRPGALYQARPDAEHGNFSIEKLMELPGRVRDAVVLEGAETPTLVTVTRAGSVQTIRSEAGQLRFETLYSTTMGMGRIVQRPQRAGEAMVLYNTLDDGRVLRHEGRGGDWRTETIYRGPQGPRGIASGRFHEDASVECLAVFGYSSRVQMLSRAPGEDWKAETIFVDRDKGHWLSRAELDGRNGTDELLCSGYGGRIVQLSRPPGYGLDDGAPVDPDSPEEDGD